MWCLGAGSFISDRSSHTGYDRYIKLWDTERGECISRFTNKKVPYCVKFNPDEDKQHLFVAGLSDKKILCVSDAAFSQSANTGYPLFV